MSDQTPSVDTTEETKKEFERRMEEERVAQNLPEGAVPEQRPQATTQPLPGQLQSEVDRKLEEAQVGPHAPAMDKTAYDKAASDSHAKKAAKEERQDERLYPGATAVIDNEESPYHGVQVAVNAVGSWASVEDERVAAAGTPESRFAKVDEYECATRDERAERIFVKAEHLKRIDPASFGRAR